MLPKYLKPFHVNKSNLIRIGPKTDGGYIVDKRILGKNNILVTCGLNDDWEFEKEFVKKNKDHKLLKKYDWDFISNQYLEVFQNLTNYQNK